ncbi:eukaryotic translation initiation factor 4E-1A isoform X2 [Misgurnus anguillicaudatus]|uniref:eukaryotic translation initiation factor 4E-1A isoform X2 n=1 Tax=Misgurnus anguillicaudatus TaxID=75329 RepID=UPI002435B50A|nr:eukaryotic translation initiation factor 4E-1A isoform X2 [Misgurnus anguillicaudatus]
MATAEPENSTNPLNTEEDKNDENRQEIVSLEDYIKHPLQNRWALWFFKNDKSKTWQANLRLISKFDTVEDFWALYNHIQLSSNLMSGCDYSLFKLLCLVGEGFDDHSDDVCGAVVNVRTKGDKISIWTTDYENKDAVVHIGRVYKERLGVPAKVIIGYQSHADTATKSGSTTKNKFVV